ncbi:unnamed protein product [Rotaria sp. Silwood1]|nr:unnamed protein product [Rotaria sp. Silwood1]
MSISIDDRAFILYINNISIQINRYVPIFLLLFGIIGHLTSCLVFVQRALRTNPCSIYFLAASLSNLIFLTTLFVPMLNAWDKSFNLLSTVSVLCKLSMFIILTTRTLALWFIVLATIDRYLILFYNNNRHRMTDLKQTYCWILITCIVSILIWIETVYCFETNLVGTPMKCFLNSNICLLYNTIIFALISITIPSITMLIFGLLTIINIRQSQRMIYPNINTITNSNRRSRRIDWILTRMLLTQVFTIFFLNLPQAIHILYIAIIFYQPITPVKATVLGLIFDILFLLPFLSCCISFLLYILNEKIFRETLVKLAKKIIQRLKCNN